MAYATDSAITLYGVSMQHGSVCAKRSAMIILIDINIIVPQIVLKYWQVNGVVMIIVSFRLLTPYVDVSKSKINDSPIRATSPGRHDVSTYRQLDCSMFFQVDM